MSAGSVSSNHSEPRKQTDLEWKEGHILKGLKHLQMHSSKEASSLVSAPHCKDCMTSNEGIYSLGVKSGQQVTTAKTIVPTCKPLKNETRFTALDSDDADDNSHKLQSKSNDAPVKELLCLEKLGKCDGHFQENLVKLAGDCGLFPSPVTDKLSFLDIPKLEPGVSPTDSLTYPEETNKNSIEKHTTSGKTFSDRNNNQERSADRKSRFDHIKRQDGRLGTNHLEVGPADVSMSIQNSATRALSLNEARQRSSSVEVGHYRDQASQAGGESQHHSIVECPQRKAKPQPCDSARKAFILRSKSADAGPDQAKHIHSPLHQKLIKGHKSKEQSDHTGPSVSNKRTSLNKTHGSGKGASSTVKKDENIAVSTSSKSLESVQQRSPLASPVKHSKTVKPPGINERSQQKSPTKASLQMTIPQSSYDSVEESIYDNLPCSPRKLRRQDQHYEGSGLEHRSPSPPLPPGRTSSLVGRPNGDSLPKGHKSAGHGSTAEKMPSGIPKSHSSQISSVVQPQQTNSDNQHQMGAESNPPKDILTKMYHTHSSNIQSGPQTNASESVQSSMDRTSLCYDGNSSSSMLPNTSILQRSQQSISEPKLSEVLPQAYSNVYCHGIVNNSHTSTSVKMALPLNAKSNEAIAGQETSTFLIFGRHNKEETNSTAKSFQTFQTFTCDTQMIHDCGAHDKARRKIETRCNSLDSEPSMQPTASDSGVMLDWGFDEEGWLFKRSVSVSTRPLLKPVMGMNGAKARSQSFGARYMDRPSFNRSGKVRTQIKTHSGNSLNSLGDVLPGSMSCSSSYHCPMNRSLLNNFLIEEGLTVPSHLGSSSERLQSLKLQREHARRLQIEQQFSSAFGEPVSEEPERQGITTIEEKVMLGIEENLHKSQEQERSNEVKQKPSSTLANWFGFRKSKLPAPSAKKADPQKVKEDKREQKITSLLGGKQAKSDKKRDRRKSDGKDW